MTEEQYAEIRAALASNATEHESYNRRLREHDERLQKQSEINERGEYDGSKDRIGKD